MGLTLVDAPDPPEVKIHRDRLEESKSAQTTVRAMKAGNEAVLQELSGLTLLIPGS